MIVGIYDNIIHLSTSLETIKLRGFTQNEFNDLVVTVASGEFSCSFPLAFDAEFEDRTADANRTEILFIDPDAGGGGESLLDVFFGAIGDVFDFFGGMFGALGDYIVIIIIVLVALCCFPTIIALFRTICSSISSAVQNKKQN